MSNKLFGSAYRPPFGAPLPMSFVKPTTVTAEGSPVDLIGVYDARERETYQNDESLRVFARKEARCQFDAIETEILSVRKKLSSVTGKMKKQIANGSTTSKALEDEMKDLTQAKEDLMAQIGCFDDKLHTNRFDRFLMLRCFGVDDAKMWNSWRDGANQPQTLDTPPEDYSALARFAYSKEEKQKMDLVTMHLHSVLKCYSDWIGNTIGEVDYIDIEIQEVALGVKGALGQHIWGSLLYAATADRCKTKQRPTPQLRYIKPHCKLRVFPLSNAEAREMMNDGIIQQENRVYTGRAKNRKQRWSPIVKSSKGCSRIFVNKEAMVEEHRMKYLASFETAMAEFKRKLLSSRKSDEPATASSSSISTCDTPAGSHAASTVKDEHASAVIVIDDDDENVEEAAQQQQQKKRLSSKKRRATTDLSEETGGDLASAPPLKKKASKPRFRNGKPVFDKAKKSSRQKTAAPGDKSGNRWFSVGSRNVAIDREVNKLESVRRTMLIVDNHEFEILGEDWKERFKHRHDSSQRRDMSDGFLMCMYGLFKHWSNVDSADGKVKPVRIWAIDYGEEKIGMVVLYQRAPDAPVIIEFWDTISAFDVPPTYDRQYRWLCSKYQAMRPSPKVVP